jgi:hypothetical protein
MVYLIDRPPGATYFVSSLTPHFSLHNILPNLFGSIGKILPGFVHVFSFALITAGLLGCQKKGCLIVCLVWFGINSTFELGQNFDTLCLSIVPDIFAGIPLLENIGNFFQQGTFDFFDLVAMAAGGTVACAALFATRKGRCT